MTAWVPATATIFAGILVYFGSAKDYDMKTNGQNEGKFLMIEDFVE